MEIIQSAGFEVDGITTIVWGTDGALQSPFPADPTYAGVGFYSVDTIDENEKSEQIYGENGTGIETWRVLLKHGKRWNVSVQDDTSMSAPAVGTSVQVVDYLGDKTDVYAAKVLDNNYRTAKRQAGQRVLLVENLALVDAQP